jgi:hypothetical protein
MKHGKKKSKYKWVPWALGIGTAGVVAYILLRPKTAAAGQLPQGQPTPPIIPGPGNIQITVGSRVPLTDVLKATVPFTGDTVNVPKGTVITVEKLDADGTLWFRYNSQLLSSPVEVYSAVVGMPLN